MKKLWAILVMLKNFLPRVFGEIDDVKVLWQEMKDEWYLKFPPKTYYVEEDEEIPFTPKPGRIGVMELKERTEGCSKMFMRELEKEAKAVPDGRSYFKEKDE